MKEISFRFFYALILLITQILSAESNKIFDYSHIRGTKLSIQAGPVSSKRAIIPYGYTRLHICNSQRIKRVEDTLGEILTGNSYYSTEYLAKVNEDTFCNILCYNNFTERDVNFFQKLIKRRYFSNMVVDKLPAGLILYNNRTKQTMLRYFDGIPLGYAINDTYYIYNHLQFHILLNKIDEDRYNVVGFNILPMSIKHDGNIPNCVTKASLLLQNLDKSPQPLTEGRTLFTYDVVYEYSDIPFASRWDHYRISKSAIHWTGIIISEVLVGIATVFVIYLLRKNLRQDIDTYNYKVSQFEDINDYDWKQVAGDVFRPPRINKLLLASMVGTGCQLLSMITITLFLAVVGFMNPEKRNNILNIGILFFCFCGLFAGYVSANFYRFWGGQSWIRVSIFTSMLFPGTILFGYLIINIILIIEKSNAAVNFSDIISLFILWICCTFPLILIGSFFGYKSNHINIPCEINKIPSFIPEKPWYLHYRYITFVTGLIGFATIFIELNYVMGALWRHQIYFLATFLGISIFLFVLVMGEMSILVVYYNLCYGDYNWWWKSFIIGASPVIYFVLYSIIYFFYLRISTISAMVIYFGIMGMISAMVIFICGVVSVFFCMGFLNKIYSEIRID